MAAVTLKDQLNGLVSSMFVEGLLDDQFSQLQMLQDVNNPGFVAEVITLFCEDAERLLNELTKLLEQHAVDYHKVDAYVHQLKGSSSSVGASHVKQACIDFRQFCEDNNKEGCLHTLNLVKHEYYRLRTKFETMVQAFVILLSLITCIMIIRTMKLCWSRESKPMKASSNK